MREVRDSPPFPSRMVSGPFKKGGGLHAEHLLRTGTKPTLNKEEIKAQQGDATHPGPPIQ